MLILSLASQAKADFVWSDNSTWNRARVIPPRQHAWGFRTTYQQFDSRFGADGNNQAMGQPFDRKWSWNQIMAAEPAKDARAALGKYMASNQLNGSDIAAATSFDLKRQETTFEMAWAYGLSERWMIGIQMPISLVDTQMTSQTAITPALGNALVTRSANVTQQVQALVQKQLAAQGYEPIHNRTQNVIFGDVAVMSQVAFFQDTDWAFSLQQMARIPSSQNGNTADYISYSRDDGQVDVGMTALLDHQWRRFLFGTKLGYLIPIPDSQRMRVNQTGPDQQSSTTIDTSIHRNLGNLLSASAESFYRISQKFSINAAYLGFFKNADRYKGDAPNVDYVSLGANTAQELHLVRAGVSWIIGEPTARSQVENKWIANMNFYQPVGGRNISEGPMGALELQTLF